MSFLFPDWRDRLRPVVSLISPEGSVFEGNWRDSDQVLEKKVGIFSYPRVRGNVVQDLEANSDRFSIPFSFSGKDHDIIAKQFMITCRERGQWQVTHPFKGFLALQLLKVTQLDRTVSQGNITRFDTEWIEPIDETSLQTGAELLGLVNTDVDLLNIAAALQFANNIVDNTIAQISAVQRAVNSIKTFAQTALGPIAQLNATIEAATRGIANGIDDTVEELVLAPFEIAGQIQNLIQLPLRSTTDISDRLNAYADLTDRVLTLSPGGNTAISKNTIATQELALSAVIGANAQTVVTGPPRGTGSASISGGFDTRSQSVQAIDSLQNRFISITDNLDALQKQFENSDIDAQYFSQTETYTRAREATARSARYLLQTGFDLSIERRFTIDRPKTPLQVTIEEYGSLGDDDSNLDLFINSNELKGNDILLLPRGKEVVIYA
jgi:hypothetical protein